MGVMNHVAAILPSNNRLERIWKLAQVDFQSRYYNDRLGLLWALIKPLFEVSLYYIVFTQFFRVENENYGIYLFGGIVIWSVLAESTSRGMYLLQHKLYLIDNIQFNHADIFVSNMLSTLFGFLFNFSAFWILAMFIGSNIVFYPHVLFVALSSLLILTMGLSFILATCQPFFRDLVHLWDMVILSGFWTSGILYDAKILFEEVNVFAMTNPMVGIIYNMRAAIIGTLEVRVDLLWINLLTSLIILLIGWTLFKRWGTRAIEKL